MLLPLAAMNYAVEKARDYFESRFPDQFAKKLESVPPEDLVEPRASIAGPVLQGLAFSHEEQPLREMYLNLLRSSMDRRSAPNAHPAFVETIKQSTAEEARHLNAILASTGAVAIGEVRLENESREGWKVLYRHLANLTDDGTGERSEDPRFPMMVDNWVRLGLVEVRYDTVVIGDGAYDWMEARPEYVRLCEKHSKEGDVIKLKKGLLKPTDFGLEFGAAAGIPATGSTAQA